MELRTKCPRVRVLGIIKRLLAAMEARVLSRGGRAALPAHGGWAELADDIGADTPESFAIEGEPSSSESDSDDD